MYAFACYKSAICMNISVCFLAAEKRAKFLTPGPSVSEDHVIISVLTLERTLTHLLRPLDLMKVL